MRYNYNATIGAFEREDKIGKKIWATMNEAQRVITLSDLGYTMGEIQSKVSFKSNKATGYTVRTIIDKYECGDLEIDMNAPIPVEDYRDLTVEERLNDLERRLSVLEESTVSESLSSKVRGLFR